LINFSIYMLINMAYASGES